MPAPSPFVENQVSPFTGSFADKAQRLEAAPAPIPIPRPAQASQVPLDSDVTSAPASVAPEVTRGLEEQERASNPQGGIEDASTRQLDVLASEILGFDVGELFRGTKDQEELDELKELIIDQILDVMEDEEGEKI